MIKVKQHLEYKDTCPITEISVNVHIGLMGKLSRYRSQENKENMILHTLSLKKNKKNMHFPFLFCQLTSHYFAIRNAEFNLG